jgi:plasmid stabilization system protein ParE
MVKAIRWTAEAEETFIKVIDYLKQEWSEPEIAHFINATNSIIERIAQYPKMYRNSTKKRNVHEALVTEHNLLIYKVYPSRIDLLLFWDTHQNPKLKKS